MDVGKFCPFPWLNLLGCWIQSSRQESACKAGKSPPPLSATPCCGTVSRPNPGLARKSSGHCPTDFPFAPKAAAVNHHRGHVAGVASPLTACIHWNAATRETSMDRTKPVPNRAQYSRINRDQLDVSVAIRSPELASSGCGRPSVSTGGSVGRPATTGFARLPQQHGQLKFETPLITTRIPGSGGSWPDCSPTAPRST